MSLCITTGGLESLKTLHTLDVSYNQLITTRGLSDAPSIQVLDVSHNHLANLDDLHALALLQVLRATGNNLMQVWILCVDVASRYITTDKLWVYWI